MTRGDKRGRRQPVNRHEENTMQHELVYDEGLRFAGGLRVYRDETGELVEWNAGRWIPVPLHIAAVVRAYLFDAHLTRASRTVSQWPAWKRNVLGTR